MWQKCAHTLYPLPKLCSTRVKFKWNEVEQNAYMEMNKIVGHNILLSYPNVREGFIIHTNASNNQIGGLMSQNGNPITF